MGNSNETTAEDGPQPPTTCCPRPVCVPCPPPPICIPTCTPICRPPPWYIPCYSEPGKGSTVANASGKTLRIFYHKEEIKLEDLLEKDSKTGKRVFKPQANMSFMQLQPKEQLVAPSVEEGFASVLVADPEDTEVYVETISLNFPVPYGACCIVTAKNEIKYRKCDAGIWIDEDGHDHCT